MAIQIRGFPWSKPITLGSLAKDGSTTIHTTLPLEIGKPIRKNITMNWLSGFFLMLIAAIQLGCGGAGDVTKPTELGQILLKRDGWIMLPLPDSKYLPGSVIQATEESGVRYLGHLKSCGVPSNVLKPDKGSAPKIAFTKDESYDAKATLSFKGISAGPEFGKIKKAKLTIDEHSADALDLVKISVWLTDPDNAERIPQVCSDWLGKPNTFVVNEAYVIKKGKYSLYDQKGGQIKLSADSLLKLFATAGGEAKISSTQDGDMEFTQEVTLAIRRAQRIGNSFQTLSPGSEADLSGDDIIRRSFEKIS